MRDESGKFIRHVDTLMVGSVYNRLTVIGESEKRDTNRGKYYFVKCECGTIKEVRKQCLIYKKIKSCGCLNIEIHQKIAGKSTWNSMFYITKKSAEKRGHSFNLTMKEYMEIAEKNCYYCGDPAPRKSRYTRKRVTDDSLERSFVYANGIDRQNNELGYEFSNCVPCCTCCNEMKMDRTVEFFMNHICKIMNFRKDENV